MRFSIREAAYKRFAVTAYPYFRKVGMNTYKWCTKQDAHIFNDCSEVPNKFLTNSGRLKRRYILVIRA